MVDPFEDRRSSFQLRSRATGSVSFSFDQSITFLMPVIPRAYCWRVHWCQRLWTPLPFMDRPWSLRKIGCSSQVIALMGIVAIVQTGGVGHGDCLNVVGE